jgi:glucose/arabinose dehydrogenase
MHAASYARGTTTGGIMNDLLRPGLLLLLTGLVHPGAARAIELPAGFEAIAIPASLEVPTGFAFAPDATIFVIELAGVVRVHDGASQQAAPFIDLTAEVNRNGDRGLLGIALHPGFVPDGGPASWVYLQYTVSPIPGRDLAYNEDNRYSFSRLTRYRATTKGTGEIVADLGSRQVLLGHKLPNGVVPDGITSCHDSHASGAMAFARDGSLLLANGDGAHYDFRDTGGADPACFASFVHPVTGQRGPMKVYENSGAFRAQDLRSLSGKLLRIDPETGRGYPSNPWFDGDPSSNASRVWALGLRNPYRFALKPGTGAQDPALGRPNTIYLGDVGWNVWEETDVARGGENFGWPCFEGMDAQPNYQDFERGADPLQRPDCDVIPAPLHAPPLLAWHHLNAGDLAPPGFYFDEDGNPLEGFAGSTSTGGAFYANGGYPPEYRGRYFFGDYAASWIKTIETDANDQLVAVRDFAFDADGPVDFERHPLTGDIYYVAIYTGTLYRISHTGAR